MSVLSSHSQFSTITSKGFSNILQIHFFPRLLLLLCGVCVILMIALFIKLNKIPHLGERQIETSISRISAPLTHLYWEYWSLTCPSSLLSGRPEHNLNDFTFNKINSKNISGRKLSSRNNLRNNWEKVLLIFLFTFDPSPRLICGILVTSNIPFTGEKNNRKLYAVHTLAVMKIFRSHVVLTAVSSQHFSYWSILRGELIWRPELSRTGSGSL